ncbi:amino acid permease [Fictibacillus iocasae]|uniref:Amino acid permease n=1 Tax=Fictibacillus iocasae TaxID=2715437 RepID=A0ABW2NR87_9BACL
MKKGGCSTTAPKGELKWWQLSLIGVGCIIGTGYFLGSGIAIKTTGPSVLLSYLLAAVCTYIVYSALAKMSSADPQKGSFCAYSEKAYGRWAGFSCGWVYWTSETLIVGSQLTALSIFSQFWFPHVPLWIFAAGYALCGLAVIVIGTKGFERVENILAIIKVAAIFMFIIIAILAFSGVLHGDGFKPKIPSSVPDFFVNGFSGWWSSLLFAFYAFGGIEIMGLMAIKLKDKEDSLKAGRIMLLVLAIIYTVSIGLAVTMVSWTVFNDKESPFVLALQNFDLPFFPHIFNGALLIAGFSTMTASLFAVTSLLVTLAEGGNAPEIFEKGKKIKNIPWPSLLVTIGGISFSIILSLAMPGKVYEYLTTGAGLMLLYNWAFILLSSYKLIELTLFEKGKNIAGFLLIFAAISGTCLEKTSRTGFFVSLGFLCVIVLVLLKMKRVWKNESSVS